MEECSGCGRRSLVKGGVRAGRESLVCGSCVRDAKVTVADALDETGSASAVIAPEQLAAMDALGHELTGEQEFSLAVATEQLYGLDDDGRPVLEAVAPARVGRA